MVYNLKRIGVMKMAFFMGLYGFAIGLISGILVALVASSLSVPTGGSTATIDLLNLGWIAVIVLPFVYGIINFLLAFILVPLINLVLKIIKGVEFDLVEGEANPTIVKSVVKPQKVQQPKRIVSKIPELQTK